ncbi:hypothetical protein [Polaromonas aquatica]|uniref:hypothetical protein n=1 Tax=Polaromonas aquatica TaxID=332657 RepID=UPI003D646A0E
MQLKGIEAVSVVDQIRCDRCGNEVHSKESGFEQMTSIGFDAGYGSIFGDGNRVEIDLCEPCLRATLGTWLRVRSPWSIDQMPQGEISAGAERPPPTIDSQDPGRFAHLYGVLTVQEMAAQLKCLPKAVYERAVAGEFIFLSSPDRVDDRRYPAFQLNERLDKSLLKQTIQKYLEADINSTLLWSFLRSPQKIYAGLTAIEMLLGGMPPQYDTLTPEERADIFLDVVDEEISRVRW